jgi:hypothetical protein
MFVFVNSVPLANIHLLLSHLLPRCPSIVSTVLLAFRNPVPRVLRWILLYHPTGAPFLLLLMARVHRSSMLISPS